MDLQQGTVTLLINPAAGRAALLGKQLPRIESLLASRGLATKIVYTTPDPDSAKQLAQQASADSATIIACGGDGTVHGAIQGLAYTGVPLGVLPLGTANALARNLRLPLDPLAAITRLLTFTPASIPLGRICTASTERYFLIMAGCGPDGALVHALTGASASRFKSRFGRGSYYLQAARLFFTRRWPAFQVQYRLANQTEWHTTTSCALLAARIPDLGGLFTNLTPKSTLEAPCLHVQILKPPAHLSFAAWFTLSRASLPNPLLTTLDVEELRCIPLTSPPIYAQADAEPIGTLPLHMRLIPNALTLLLPSTPR